MTITKGVFFNILPLKVSRTYITWCFTPASEVCAAALFIVLLMEWN